MKSDVRVLIVEDDLDDIWLTRRLLSDRVGSFAIEDASTLADAAECLRADHFDVALVDLGLPDSQGLDTFAVLNGVTPHAALIVLTGNSDLDIALQAVRAGACDYLVKGAVDGDGLERSIRYAIERQKAENTIGLERTRLAAAEEVAHFGSWRFEPATKRVWFSDEAHRIFGFDPASPPEDFLDAILARIHPDDVHLGRLVTEGAMPPAPTAPVTIRLVLPDVPVRWIEVGSRNEIDPESRETVVTGFVHDVTELTRARQREARSNARNTRLVFAVAEMIGKAMEMRDPYTQGHEVRVSRLAKRLAETMTLPQSDVEGIEMAGLLHDVGKLRVPSEILSKPGRLTDGEFMIIREHPSAGYELLQPIEFPWPIADIALMHHERLDGSGYPAGLSGEEIPMSCRVIAVADVVEAMASHRPYRPSLGLAAAMAELAEHPEKYDGAVVEAFGVLCAEGSPDLDGIITPAHYAGADASIC